MDLLKVKRMVCAGFGMFGMLFCLFHAAQGEFGPLLLSVTAMVVTLAIGGLSKLLEKDSPNTA